MHEVAWPVGKLRPGALIYHPEWSHRILSPKHFDITQMSGKGVAARQAGELSPAIQRKIYQSILLLKLLAVPSRHYNPGTGKYYRHYLSWMTLTLSADQGNRTDAEIKKHCLDPFLKAARRRWGMAHWVMRAERQKNGNLHFHFITTAWIPHQELRAVWNRSQDKLGFVQAFHKKHGHSDPNSTDIKSIQKLKQLQAYMTKYMVKLGPKNVKIGGRVWSCSESISSGWKCTWNCWNEDYDRYHEVSREMKDKLVDVDYAQFYRLSDKDLITRLPKEYLERFNHAIENMRHYERKKQRRIPKPVQTTGKDHTFRRPAILSGSTSSG
jgi:hypothetical protein